MGFWGKILTIANIVLLLLSGYSNSRKCDPPADAAGECAVAVLRLPLLLLHPRLLPLAGHLPQQTGTLALYSVPVPLTIF